MPKTQFPRRRRQEAGLCVEADSACTLEGGDAPRSTLAFLRDVVVHEVVRELFDLYVLVPGILEHLFGLLLAPHRAQALATLRERDRHAVHGRDGVEEQAYRMI
jgi:hypothetical protein